MEGEMKEMLSELELHANLMGIIFPKDSATSAACLRAVLDSHDAMQAALDAKDEEIASLKSQLSHARARGLHPVTAYTARAIWSAGLSEDSTYVLEMCYRSLEKDLDAVLKETIWAMEFIQSDYTRAALKRAEDFLASPAVRDYRARQEQV